MTSITHSRPGSLRYTDDTNSLTRDRVDSSVAGTSQAEQHLVLCVDQLQWHTLTPVDCLAVRYTYSKSTATFRRHVASPGNSGFSQFVHTVDNEVLIMHATEVEFKQKEKSLEATRDMTFHLELFHRHIDLLQLARADVAV